ncbi:hypothetical protein FS749_009967 [Ceratobasidium sp. UAMH 11750]|nr:hypothetical protein FS749_009967 [Ceratobasidium sp. UAMH 11750]
MAGPDDKKSHGVRPIPPALGRRAAMVAIVFALVASAVFRWAVIGIWRGAPLEVVPSVSAQGSWCGKYYEPGQPPRTPGGKFPIPPPSPTPLLRFECWPSLRPYVSGLDSKGSVLLSASAVNTTPGVAYSPLTDGSLFHVTAELDGRTIASNVPLSIGTDNQTPAFDFVKAGIAPRRDAYNLTCSAISVKSGKVFRSGGAVQYLPPVPRDIGGVVQMDGRTGGLVAGQGKKRAAVLPFGFYTSFGGYLEKNVTVLDEIKAEGFNMVHPVPTFDNATALELVLDRMEELGLWLIYDMRWSYKNLTAVRAEVEAIKKRKNLLAWYTADEPDGWEDALDAPQKAADIINELDGYRPVALVLNCADYHFTEYTAHSQIILHDTYPVGINATWSTVWNTPCTPELGDCGCDNCEGKMEDIAVRVDAFRERLVWQGRAKEAVVWSVPQAFGPESYWARKPTPQELALEMLLAINHGSLGIMPWIDHPQDPLMRPGISPLAKAIPSLAPYILGDRRIVGRPAISGAQRIDATIWTNGDKTLLIALNLNDASVQAHISVNSSYVKPQVVFENGAAIARDGNGVQIKFQPLSSIAVII